MSTCPPILIPHCGSGKEGAEVESGGVGGLCPILVQIWPSVKLRGESTMERRLSDSSMGRGEMID